MSLRAKLLSASGGVDKLYVDDVFSAYTYTGTGATQTINNGIDLAGKGGLVWIKDRGSSYTHQLFDTTRSVEYRLQTSASGAQSLGPDSLTAFNSNGYALGTNAGVNANTLNYISWTFRKAPKFFDVVTYTGNGANRDISHSLGTLPGMVIVKCTSASSNWWVYHRGIGLDDVLFLNTTAASSAQSPNPWRPNAITSTTFPISSNSGINSNGATYVAYLFAHDPSADGIIQCGSFTVPGPGVAVDVNLGWEAQFVITKVANQADNWVVGDVMRGMDQSAIRRLLPNLSNAEESITSYWTQPTATGFKAKDFSNGGTYTYLAIRRPNKPPTSGTQVYNAIARTGTGAAATITGVGFAPDVCWAAQRDGVSETGRWDRLRGGLKGLRFNADSELVGTAGVDAFTMDGVSYVGSSGTLYSNTLSLTYINHFFKRAPGVLSQICYSGTGANKTESHDLGVAPELWLVKGRSGSTQWVWGSSLLANTEKIVMPTPAGKVTDTTAWNSTYPTSTSLSLGTAAAVNTSAATYTAYLWATKAGVSKVFSYTGNGASQNIDCGFTTGARFILIVRTSAAGSVYIWDTTRGVVAGNDPHLALDTTAAEVTTDDSVDPDSSGFIVNQVTATNINVTSATYIGLALA